MAIALDSANNGTAVSGSPTISYSHTCTGSNRILFAMPASNSGDRITGVTYNGVAMTLIGKLQCPFAGWIYLFVLVNPASGSNTLLATTSSNDDLEMMSTSYTGAAQSGQPDNSDTDSFGAPGEKTFDTSITTVADNCWVIASMACNTGAISAGTDTVIRGNQAAAFSMGMFDSGTLVHPAGSRTLEVQTSGAAAAFGAVVASFAPAATSQILKVSGVAQASISKVSGVANASIKKISGVSNQ